MILIVYTIGLGLRYCSIDNKCTLHIILPSGGLRTTLCIFYIFGYIHAFHHRPLLWFALVNLFSHTRSKIFNLLNEMLQYDELFVASTT
jgi:hypothetical protein